ncbi:hypothetical protein LWI28_013348 [Acer negundo]|uniref:Phytochrome n=1 Tax=Acer negundo TaxID=4023 RepID=A0AAD5NQH2_ACENE|nr:hypothetical protein LWI28_013348 [Acer negundo]
MSTKPSTNIWIRRQQCPCGDWKCYIKYEGDDQLSVSSQQIKTETTSASSSLEAVFTPYVGQIFKSDEEAFEYYSNFARKNGFSIRKARSTESQNLGIYRRDFVCYRSGFNQPRKKANVEHPRDRKSVRCGCDAKLYLTKEIVDGVTQWYVSQFSNVHNHELLEDDQVRLLPAYRKIQEADQERILLLSKAGFPVNRIVKVLELEKGVQPGQLPFIEKDVMNFVRTCKKTVQENDALLTEKRENDTLELLEACKSMVERDADFVYDYTTDENDKVENIAWSYGDSIRAYSLFGDVVTFDTTYCSITYGLLLGVWFGMDNHGETISFGCVLLQDESSQSFIWALQTFVRFMRGSCPQTILTDIDSGLRDEFKAEFNMLCHLEGVEAFEHQWNLLVARFGLVSDKHIALLSSYRASWPFSYIRGYFLAWTMTIEFSQSLEIFLKRILSGQTCLQVFFEQVRAAANFGNLTREGMQYMHIKTCMPIEEHARSILTPYAFRVIQHEIELSMQYATRMDGEYLVIWIPEDEQIHCSFNVIQDKKLDQPLSLCGSVLRSPHGCNAQYMANMGSIASLVMSVTINGEDDEQDEDQQKGRKLWGLVVCHHTSQREKHIMQTQTLLCDMLLRDSPVGIVAQSPNVKDLVKCDGAALYYGKKLWLLGVTPTEAQIKDIADWLLECHSASTGLSTDSLVEAGYPDASLLGDAVKILLHYFVGQDITGQKLITDKYTRIQGDYVNIVRSPSALIPPIFMTDEHGRCMEWNDAMEKLSGLKREEATDRMLLGEVFTVNSFGCRVKNVDTLTKLRIILNRVIAGQDADKLLFGFFDQQGKYVEGLLSANKRTDAEGNLTGALCFLHVTSPELQYALQVQRISEQAAANSFNKLAYIRREIKKPLGGIAFMQDLMGSSDLSKEQKQLLKTSLLCQEQLTKIVDDNDINLAEALEAVMTQVMILSNEHQVQLIRDLPDEVSSMNLYGDRLRLQQVLSDFLTNALIFTPAYEGSSIAFRVIPRKQRIGKKIHIVHLEFRITHPAPGIPEKLIHEMFYHSQGASREGLGLYMCQKLVKIMNGTVQYVREAEKSSFIILIEFPLAL